MLCAMSRKRKEIVNSSLIGIFGMVAEKLEKYYIDAKGRCMIINFASCIGNGIIQFFLVKARQKINSL